MNDYERLSDIKWKQERDKTTYDDIEWLIEQAENLQKVEYEIDHSDMGTAVDNIINIVKG